MEFRYLKKNEMQEWDKFVDMSPQGSIFATSVFLNALGQEYHIGAVTNQNDIIAGIILAKNELKSYSNPLFAKYLGIMLSPQRKNESYVNKFSKDKKIISLIVDNVIRIKSFDYTFHPNFTNWLPFYWKGFQQETRYTYRFLDISDINLLKEKAHSRTRNDIRKAEKNNIKTVIDIDVKKFYETNSLSFIRQGGKPPFSLNKFSRLYEYLRKTNSIHLLGAVDDQDKILAVTGVVKDKSTSYLLLNGIDHEKPNRGGNTKLIFDTIDYCSTFTREFDFEGSMIKNIEMFYQSFGAEQVPYFSISRDTIFVNTKRTLVKLYKKFKYGK